MSLDDMMVRVGGGIVEVRRWRCGKGMVVTAVRMGMGMGMVERMMMMVRMYSGCERERLDLLK